jgi:hypothetical protein
MTRISDYAQAWAVLRGGDVLYVAKDMFKVRTHTHTHTATLPYPT